VVIDCSVSHAIQINDGSPTFQNLSISCSAIAKRKTTFDGLFIKGGTPKIFHCIVTSVSGKGINVEGKKANPTVEKCTIKNCGQNGVYVNKKGSGVFKECEMNSNVYAGIVVLESGNPTVIECRIHDGSQGGILVWKKGLGNFRNCDIYGNGLAGVEVRELGNPTLVGCKIHNGKLGGVLVWMDGRGQFNDCEIYENKMAGIEVRAAGKPIVTKCNIHDGEKQGIWIHSKGMGMFTYNKLSENYYNGTLSNWVIDPSAGPVKAVGNQPPFQRKPALAPIRVR
jgi:parallel beta-helix repeat protein